MGLKRPAVGLLLLLATGIASAQSYLGVGADFGTLVRRGVWSETYGPTALAGARIEAANEKGLLLNVQGELLFGNDVKVDPIAGLRTEVGLLGDEESAARPVDIALKSRGVRLSVLLGYQALFGETSFGWRVLAGPSYTTHNIRIQDDATLTTSNLRPAYKQGYDRRAGGIGGYAEGGIIYTQPDRQITVFLVGTLNVFNAEPLRSTQFDLGMAGPRAGTDTGIGAKVGIVTALLRPNRLSEAEDIYY